MSGTSSAAAFSSNDSDVISRKLEVKPKQPIVGSFNEYYEIPRVIKWINANKFKRVCLQFPDDLLTDSASVAEVFRNETGVEVSILADTSYGSCCVDEVAAEHFNADSIVHYGHSCLSQTERLPVLFVFCSSPIDVYKFSDQFSKQFQNESQPVILWYNVVYHLSLDSIELDLKKLCPSLILSHLNATGEPEMDRCHSTNLVELCGRTLKLPDNVLTKDCLLCYIGDENDPDLSTAATNFRCETIYVYDVNSEKFSCLSSGTTKMLARRFHLIEKTKDANIIGILIGTLGVSKYMSIVGQLKKVIRSAGKKYYTFVVGKINVVKLANFAEIDCYVLVACPQNSLLDSKEFYRPIVTPYELDVALNADRPWAADCVTDFSRLLPGSNYHIPLSESIEERFDVSLVSGKLRSLGIKKKENEDAPENGPVLLRNSATTISEIHENAAGGFLHNRSWKGLEPKLGETAVVETRQGRSGIASQYQNEPT